MITISSVKRILPTMLSTACPMIQKNSIVRTSQMWLGWFASGHVNKRQNSPSRTAIGSNTSLLNVLLSIAYTNIDATPTITISAVVVMSRLPTRNQPSRGRGSGSANWKRLATAQTVPGQVRIVSKHAEHSVRSVRVMKRPPAGTIPEAPGSYQFKDAQDRVIYVGKAA